MKKKIYFHPFLFALFPVLYIFSRNLNIVHPEEVIVPAFIVLFLALVLFLLFVLFLKNKEKAAVLTSVVIIVFFLYGHLINVFRSAPLLKTGLVTIGPIKIATVMWLLLFILLPVRIIKTSRNLEALNVFMGATSVILIALTLFNVILYKVQTGGALVNVNTKNNASTMQDSRDWPDIIYIILDGYARDDVLLNRYGFDNSDFIKKLKEMGFIVAGKSLSNYATTLLSLSTSLNMEYTHKLFKESHPRHLREKILIDLIKHSRVVDFLRSRGYVFVAFSPGINYTEITNADVFYKFSTAFSYFSNEILNTTPIPQVFRFNMYDFHRRRVLYILDHIKEINNFSKPVFMFVHLVCPHPPYVFGRDGEPVKFKINPYANFDLENFGWGKAADKKQRYLNQMTFINKRVTSELEKTIRGRKRPMIIIVQSDHGTSFEDEGWDVRFPILNAFYFSPGPIAEKETPPEIKQDITPVNSFAIILNYYFGATEPIKEDKSYTTPDYVKFEEYKL